MKLLNFLKAFAKEIVKTLLVLLALSIGWYFLSFLFF